MVDSNEFFPYCLMLGPDFFGDMKGGRKHHCYGKYIKKTNTRFKIYNKQFEVWEHDRQMIGPTLRVEQEMLMSYVHKRKHTPIHVYRPADLLGTSWITQILFELILLVERVLFSTAIGVTVNDDFKDYQIKRLMGNPVDRKFVKQKASESTYKIWNKRFNQLMEESGKLELQDSLSKLVEKKMNDLMEPSKITSSNKV
ncbi:hypothetical protein KZP23_01640 [Echinicola marina]|uniref:hypothetical protein n=1 Tax=Echinicola marina TaxID=2859768 RepID=UPI001CF6ADDD|nr:hypothetical protein [Echinicola marina]UCS93766.1 hypothetical protein KZP23_01640 [Echinicola marina]